MEGAGPDRGSPTASQANRGAMHHHAGYDLPSDLATLIAQGIPASWAFEAQCSLHMTLLERESEDLASLRTKLWYELSGGKDLAASSKIPYAMMSKCAEQDDGAHSAMWLEIGGG
eukprot:SAG31_NODE_24613_length_478_cov_0.625330_1_plen_114_part_10